MQCLALTPYIISVKCIAMQRTPYQSTMVYNIKGAQQHKIAMHTYSYVGVELNS